MAQASDAQVRQDRLLPWIAAERSFRALVLIAVGIALLSHPHADWASEITRLAQKLGLNPNDNWVQKILHEVKKVNADHNVLFGLLALAYGALESVEAYGLFHRRRWAEWLTVLATSLFLIPEAWALTKSVTPLKLGGLLVNLLIVGYLLWRLRRSRAREPARSVRGA